MASYGRCYSCILNGEELNMVAISCPWLALRRVKISEILREVHRRQNLRLGHIWTVRATKQFCHVFFPSNSRHCRWIQSPASCAGKKIRRHQEKVWTFREERHKIGRGPAASIGDADDFALGLGADEFEDATPRRRCILDSLSLEARPCCQLWHW